MAALYFKSSWPTVAQMPGRGRLARKPEPPRFTLTSIIVAASIMLAMVFYMGNPTQRVQVYVSNVAYADIPEGSDIYGDGSRSNPYYSLDRGFAVLPPGGTVYLNGNPSSQSLYTHSLGTITGSYGVQSVFAGGAVVAGTGTTSVFSMGVGGSLTLTDLTINASQNVGGAATSCILYTSSSGATPAFIATRVIFKDWSTNDCINSSGVHRGTTSLTDVDFTNANPVKGAIRVQGITAGSITILRGSCTITQNITGDNSHGCLSLDASAAGITYSITDWVANMTLDPAMTGAGTHFVVNLIDAIGTVNGGQFNCLGSPGTRQCNNVWGWADAFSITGSQIRNVSITNDSHGGHGCGWGVEGPTTIGVLQDNLLIESCLATIGATATANGFHVWFFGYTTNSVLITSTATGGGIVIVDKDNSGFVAHGNRITGFGSSAILCKGSLNSSIYSNPITQTANSGAIFWFAEQDNLSLNFCTGLALTNNIFINNGTSTIFAEQDVGTTVTPTLNTYNAGTGTLSPQAFRILGSNYGNCAAYKAAVETTASCVP